MLLLQLFCAHLPHRPHAAVEAWGEVQVSQELLVPLGFFVGSLNNFSLDILNILQNFVIAAAARSTKAINKVPTMVPLKGVK